MSVVVRDPSSQIWVFCKGAEAKVIPLVAHGQKNRTMECIHDFALVKIEVLKFHVVLFNNNPASNL